MQWTVKTWVNSLAKGRGKKKRFQYGLHSEIFKCEIISIGNLVASRQEMFPTNSFYLVEVVVLRLLATFNSLAIYKSVNRTPSHIACTDADTLSAHQT